MSESYEDRMRRALLGKVICIEGGIAAGKSSLVEALKNYLEERGVPCVIITEDVDMYLLQKFNESPATVASLFQVKMMTARLISALRADEVRKMRTQVAILDTGILRDIAFSKANLLQENMTQEFFDSHMQSLTTCFSDLKIALPDAFILLDAPSERLKDNILKRNRSNEHLLKEDYLDRIRMEYLNSLSHPLVRGKSHFFIEDVTAEYATVQVLRKVVDKLLEP